jgi:hypothetical protein
MENTGAVSYFVLDDGRVSNDPDSESIDLPEFIKKIKDK